MLRSYVKLDSQGRMMARGRNPERLLERCLAGCRGTLAATDIVLPEGPLLRCAVCGHLISQCSHEQYLDALAKWDTAAGTDPGSSLERYREVTTRRLARICRLLARPPQAVTLLDVGCSSGALLRIAQAMGFAATGVEAAEKPAAAARSAGLRVYQGQLGAQNFPAASFHAITLFELIEHLADPQTLLVECARILHPGGILAINTPNPESWTARAMGQRWEAFDLRKMGGHVSFFTMRSLQSLAARCGLQVERVETRNVRFYERGQAPPPLYLLAKIVAEALNMPARLCGRGHDRLVFLRRG